MSQLAKNHVLIVLVCRSEGVFMGTPTSYKEHNVVT